MCDMENCEHCMKLDFLRCKDPSGNAGPLFACHVVEEAPTRKLPSRTTKISTATDIPVGFDKTVLVINIKFIHTYNVERCIECRRRGRSRYQISGASKGDHLTFGECTLNANIL